MMRRAFLIALPGLVLATATAHAHKLEAAYSIRPGWRIQVEAWYQGGDPAAGARISATRSNGLAAVDDRLNQDGIFVFPFVEVETLEITITQVGHRASITIPAEKLRQNVFATCTACMAPGPAPLLPAALLVPVPQGEESGISYAPIADHRSGLPLVGVLAGAGVLIIVAIAFKWLSMRKAST
jgi:hypothetical protein